MKSDTDFANPYEKELYAQESKIKALEAKNIELEKKSKESKEGCEAVAVWYVESLKQLMDSQKKLKIAVEAADKILMVALPPNDVSGREMWNEAKEALEKIKGTK